MPRPKRAIKKAVNKQENFRKLWISISLIGLGVVLVLLPIIRGFIQDRVLSISKDEVGMAGGEKGLKAPVRITIEGKLDLALEPGEIRNNRWRVSETQGTYLTQSARLEQAGNVIIYGHNRKGIMDKLSQVRVGEIVRLLDEKGEVWRYRVIKTVAVSPKEVSWLQPTDLPMLTIYTCTGFMDSQRLIVRAGRM